MDVQMQIDAAQQALDDELAERKRKHDEEASAMEARAKAARVAHEDFMQKIEAEYSERCQRHKQEMLRLHEEQKETFKLSQAAIAELAAAKKTAAAELEAVKQEVAKQRVQDAAFCYGKVFCFTVYVVSRS